MLTPQEVETLFETLRKLAREGVSILYISHKLDEIRALCGHATILRGGKLSGDCDPRQETARSLAEMMIGRSLAEPKPADWRPGAKRLSVESLNVKSADPFGVDLKNVHFDLHAGDILGIGGVAGNGQEELLNALSGETRTAPSSIRLNDRMIGAVGPDGRRGYGLCAAPEERLGHAAAAVQAGRPVVAGLGVDAHGRMIAQGRWPQPPLESAPVRCPNPNAPPSSQSSSRS